MNMNTTDSGTTQDPDAIEQDIRHTQNEMSRTVDKLGDQLTMKNVFNALLDKADDNGVDTNYLIEGARRNPMALGLIAAGAIWLVSDKDSRFPSMPGKSKSGRSGEEEGFEGSDMHHRDYVSHMSALEMREGEDPIAYQRRRDMHRGNFLMCEQKPQEEDHSFRQRLDDLTDKFREKRRAWSDSVSSAGSSTAQSAQSAARTVQQSGRQAMNRAQHLYDGNPLIGGILAAAAGAAIGSAVPISRKEQETFGDFGAEARDKLAEQKDQLASKALEKKDELVGQAEQKLQASPGSAPDRQRAPETQNASRPIEQNKEVEAPFIISERT